MEADHTSGDDPSEESNSVENDERSPSKQLQMEVSVQVPVMQSVRGCGQGKTVDHERNKVQTARKSFKKPPLKGQQNLQGASISGKILRFRCSECKGDATFSPNDLSKHFQGIHQGSLPTFPCDMCGFVTHDFSSLQRHRLGHRDTFVRCEICNDSVQYTLLQLTRHFSMYHSLNGHYRCEKCKFSTKDVGTIVQHIHRHKEIQYKCPKCKHVSYTKVEFQKHLLVHSRKFPFTCEFCDYEAPRKDYIIRHMSSVHHKERRNKWRVKVQNPKTLVNSSPGLKLLLTKNPSRETWMSKSLHALSGGGLLEEYERLSNPEKTLEETQQFLERTVASEKESKKWFKAFKTEQQYVSQAIPAVSQSTLEGTGAPSAGFLNPGSNGLTVLMVKNKISIPPNCTTKVMGFKMVDGKKHLVLKVIPSTKPELLAKTGSSSCAVKEMDWETSDTQPEVSSQGCPANGAQQTSMKPNFPTSVSSMSTLPVVPGALVARTSQTSSATSTVPDEVPQKNGEKQPFSFVKMDGTKKLELSGEQSDKQHFSIFKTTPFAEGLSPVNKKAEFALQCRNEESSEVNSRSSKAVSDVVNPGVHKHEQKYVHVEVVHPSSDCQENVADDHDLSSPLNSSSQEVFSFHNYSKDTSSYPSNMTVPREDQSNSELLTDVIEATSSMLPLSDRSKTPCDLSMLSAQEGQNDGIREVLLNSDPLMEKVPDSEIEVDECIATVEEECNGIDVTVGLAERQNTTPMSTPQSNESLLLDNEIGLGKEANSSDFKSASEHQQHSSEKGFHGSGMQKVTGSSCRAATLGRILEEHSDAIISHQLEKERNGNTVTHDAFRQPTTLRILQSFNIKDGKQHVLLQPAENNSLGPSEPPSSPGFKIITGSSVPPVNVSYLKPGTERPGKKTTALTFMLNNGRIGKPAQIVGGKGAGHAFVNDGEESTAFICEQQALGSSGTSRLLVSNSPLKGPVFLSSPTQSLSQERTASVPTCFLVQKPLPVVAAVGRPSGEAVSQGLQSHTPRPVLAVPVNSQDQGTILHAGCQAFILRYVSPAKSGTAMNSAEGKSTSEDHLNESGGSKVLLKIVKSLSERGAPCANGELSSSVAAHAAAHQPIYLATGALQSPCFLMSSNQSNVTVSTGIKTSGSSQAPMHAPLTVSQLQKLSSATIQGKAAENGDGKDLNNKVRRLRLPPPRSNHQSAKRKRKKKSHTEDSPESLSKAKRHSSKKSREREAAVAAVPWEPVPRDVERTLRLSPFCPAQLIKCPRRNQPVIVLNHPDVDVPEVTNIMRTVNKYKGEVLKVALSQRTVDILSEVSCGDFNRDQSASCHPSLGHQLQGQNTAKERFILKLKLKKTSRNKYKVVSTASESAERSASFSCWFCGRIFDNQEEWIGHGQRHLMEATRDWNKLF